MWLLNNLGKALEKQKAGAIAIEVHEEIHEDD